MSDLVFFVFLIPFFFLLYVIVSFLCALRLFIVPPLCGPMSWSELRCSLTIMRPILQRGPESVITFMACVHPSPAPHPSSCPAGRGVVCRVLNYMASHCSYEHSYMSLSLSIPLSNISYHTFPGCAFWRVSEGRSLLTVYQSRALAAPLMNYSLGEPDGRTEREREGQISERVWKGA